MAAWFHLPGTVHAVKMLADPTRFKDRPAGGVLEIKLNDVPWHERIESAQSSWDTEPYQLEVLRTKLNGIGKHPNWPGTSDEADQLSTLAGAVSRSYRRRD